MLFSRKMMLLFLLTGLVIYSARCFPDYQNRHQFRVSFGSDYLEVFYKEFGFSYRVTKNLQPSV